MGVGTAGLFSTWDSPTKSNQQPILVHPAWAPRPEAAMLSPTWMGEASSLGASLPCSCHLNIFGKEEGFEEQGLGCWGEGVLNEGVQMVLRSPGLPPLKTASQAREFNKAGGSLPSWGPPARAAMGLGYITGLRELSPPSETAPGLGIITGPQQMVEADGWGRPSAVGHVTCQHLCRAGHGRGPRWASGEAALNRDLRVMGLAVVGHGPVPWASQASFRLLRGPGGPACWWGPVSGSRSVVSAWDPCVMKQQ